MNDRFLDKADDLGWLRETHLADVATPEELEATVCAILRGNPDCPSMVALYASRMVDEPPLAVFECSAEPPWRMMRAGWIAGWNQPGYVPECDPILYETWREARDSLIWEVERWDCEEAEQARDCEAVMAELRAAEPGTEFSTVATAIGYVFWIARAE